MSAGTVSAAARPAFGRMVGLGVAGGLAGGLAFGMMMALMGMLPMVAALIGQSDAFVGFIVHMVISAAFGAVFGAVSAYVPGTWTGMLAAGALYGVVLWIGAALVAMPLMLGMNEMVLQIGQPQIMSLIGHVVYGAIAAVVVKLLVDRGA